ncbi:hypothetical protein CCACVL1_15833 [Corchorus capsularis]|uniref:DOG1 domain-containing protein n=1 Tax=Corchorus capsularis TaxID=210143 RepID=A0A1R3I0W3_COCAP|nr:hypothetical protein CCACVL1_15833 [Corchorus capsularis]
MNNRNRLSQQDVSGFFSPSWNSALVNSMMWIAGCRPSIFIRLTYALCGSEVELQLPEIILHGLIPRGNLAQISANHIERINVLQMKTIKAEGKLSNELASLQENMADHPIAIIAKMMSRVDEPSGEIDRALDEHDISMVDIMQKADKLRLSTIKELLGILTPVQGVDILAAENGRDGSPLERAVEHQAGTTDDCRRGASEAFCKESRASGL